jgi:anthranilate synthase component 1
MSTYSPSLAQFRRLATQGNLVPVCREILADQETPVSAYERLRAGLRADGENPFTFLLESVEGGETLARYSFLGGNPRLVLRGWGRRVRVEEAGQPPQEWADADPLTVLKEYMRRFRPVPDPSLPRFTGGAVGTIGYDAVAQFDRVPLSPQPGLGGPDVVMMVADTLVAFDHVRHSMLLIANAHIEGDPEAAYRAACARIDDLAARLETPIRRRLLDVRQTPPELPLQSNTPQADFLAAVEKAKEYIRAGDIFQVVLSQRFEAPGGQDPLDVYRALRLVNPSPYMFCLELGELALAGSSPEVHVRSVDRQVDIRPIAGTRARAADPEADRALERELLADPKERAEHVMLVDLARNDIGRVCTWGSVKVSEFMVIERYSHVMHIVSNVRGELAADRDVYDLLKATFPAGTLSGAPKIRAMEIIAELEPSRRGVYGGAIGYFGFDGNLDSAITIRTVVLHGGKAYVQAGAGVVADSDPQKEYEETQNKAKGMLRALALARTFARHPGSA